VKRFEVVEAEFEPVRQSLGYEVKLDANTDAGEIVNRAMVNGGAVNQNSCRVVSPGALRPSIFHLSISIQGSSVEGALPGINLERPR